MTDYDTTAASFGTAVLVGQSLTSAYFDNELVLLKTFNLQFHRHLFAHTKTVALSVGGVLCSFLSISES